MAALQITIGLANVFIQILTEYISASAVKNPQTTMRLLAMKISN